VVEGYLAGVHRSPLHGRSVDFAEHRPYSYGDELRHVDWRLWGRSDRFYVKLYEEETNVRCYFLVDASASMGYASGAVNKFDYAATLAASLACILLQQQDAVALRIIAGRPPPTPQHSDCSAGRSSSARRAARPISAACFTSWPTASAGGASSCCSAT
jgi:uncharacterized protein (DUF58 family)